jgi:hypothetical protein
LRIWASPHTVSAESLVPAVDLGHGDAGDHLVSERIGLDPLGSGLVVPPGGE